MTSYKTDKERLTERYKVIQAFTESQHIFGSKILDKYREYIIFDESVPNVCSRDAPSELAWRNYIIDINTFISNSINIDEQKLHSLNSNK